MAELSMKDTEVIQTFQVMIKKNTRLTGRV